MLDGEILQAAAAQLSYDYSCRPDDFSAHRIQPPVRYLITDDVK